MKFKEKEGLLLALVAGILLLGIVSWGGLSLWANYSACAKYFPDEAVQCFFGSKYRIDRE